MVTPWVTVSVLALLCFGASYGEDVVTVDADNFEKVVTSHPNVVVEFYAPWCGHCKKLAPEYEKAAGILSKEENKVILAKCDATDEKNKGLAGKYGIRSYPTLKMFQGSVERAKDYSGPREVDGIVNYLKKAYGPASKAIFDVESLEEFMKNDVVVLGVFQDENSTEFNTFFAAAQELKDDVDIGHTFNTELVKKCKELDCRDAKIMMFIPEDELFEVFSSPVQKEDLVKWVEKTMEPKLPELKSSNRMKKALSKIFATKKIRLVVFTRKDDSRLAEMKEVLIKAREDEDEVAILFGETDSNDAVVKQFGVNPDDFPAFVAHDPETNLKYLHTKAKPEDFHEFLRKLKAGLLEANMKSEDPPESNDGPVMIVTAKTYKEIVLDSQKNVFIEFYAPWCGHCKKLAPTYEELGEHYKDKDTLIIAKMDATKNDVPDPRIKITGFPTLKFVSGVDGSITDYKGKRGLSDLISFVDGKIGALVEDEDDEYLDEEDTGKDEL